MTCPRCENVTLDERDRQGVVVDSCPKCRGIWLDRGELEKLITRATGEIDQLERRYQSEPGYRRHHDDDDSPPPVHHGQGAYHKKKKRGWLDAFDIFD